MSKIFQSLGFVVFAMSVIGSSAMAADPEILVATKTEHDEQFTGVQSALQTAITKVNSVVSNTITQAGDIGTLATTKQTRPATNCANDKKCLLVKNPQQALAWYEIVDCDQDEYLADMGQGYDNSPITRDTVCTSSNSSTAGCNVGEWVSSLTGGYVMGVAKQVSIAESARGTIVTLADNAPTSGRTCACKVTGYRVRDAQNSTYGTRVDVTTSKWVIAGKLSNGQQTGCDVLCARYGADWFEDGTAQAYYASVGTSCSPAASSATMCTYNSFFDSILMNGADAYEGAVRTNGSQWAACGANYAPLADVASDFQAHCATTNTGTWIEVFRTLQNGDENEGTGSYMGYVYGIGGWTTVPSGTSAYSVVDVNANSVSSTYNPSTHNAFVCMATGYKAAGSGSDTQVTAGKALVIAVGNVSHSYSMDGCGEYLSTVSQTSYPAYSYYSALAEICNVQ